MNIFEDVYIETFDEFIEQVAEAVVGQAGQFGVQKAYDYSVPWQM
jgi:hypothetical protein